MAPDCFPVYCWDPLLVAKIQKRPVNVLEFAYLGHGDKHTVLSTSWVNSLLKGDCFSPLILLINSQKLSSVLQCVIIHDNLCQFTLLPTLLCQLHTFPPSYLFTIHVFVGSCFPRLDQTKLLLPLLVRMPPSFSSYLNNPHLPSSGWTHFSLDHRPLQLGQFTDEGHQYSLPGQSCFLPPPQRPFLVPQRDLGPSPSWH